MQEFIKKNTNTVNLPTRIYIGIPAFNVQDTIIIVLDEIIKLGIAYNIMVVDDSSDDNTYQMLSNYNHPCLTVLRHPANLGYGAGIKTLLNEFNRRASNPDDILVIVHGDGQTPPAEIPQLIDPFSDSSVDIVLGSRMLAGFRAQFRKRAIYKILCDYILTFVQNILYGMKLSTYASGYRAFRKRAVNKLDYRNCGNRHSFDTEVLIKARIARLVLKEIPVCTLKGTGVSYNALINYAINSIKLMVKYGIYKRF